MTTFVGFNADARGGGGTRRAVAVKLIPQTSATIRIEIAFHAFIIATFHSTSILVPGDGLCDAIELPPHEDRPANSPVSSDPLLCGVPVICPARSKFVSFEL